MSDTYVILWNPDRPQIASGSNLVNRFNTPGSGGAPGGPRLISHELNKKDLADILRAPQLEALAPNMPTKLIEPLVASSSLGDDLWGIEAVRADASRYTGQGVKVAILDTGIESLHPAFAGIQIVECDFSGTGNGDKEGHGTHCAGTIFGRDIGGTRIGIARGVDSALVGKVLGHGGNGSSKMIFEGLQWAIRENAQVISMSLGLNFPGAVSDKVDSGWPTDLATSWALQAYRQNMRMFEALINLAKAKAPFDGDPVIIAAAGNESKRAENPLYRIAASLPAATADVVSVGALRRSGGTKFAVADFSNSNPVIAAPGVEIKSAWIGTGLNSISGTSMACPHVAGVAALWAQAIRESGKVSSGATIRSHLIANARSDVFEASIDFVDVGNGLVTSP